MWYLMKKWIHAKYFKGVIVTCICGNTFTVNATVEGPIKVETCPHCNPFFNKTQKVEKVAQGTMEKYLAKVKKMESLKKAA